MKKRTGLKLGCILIAASLGLVGCSNIKNESKENKDDGKLTVYTSFYPMYDFAKKIGGDKVNVSNLVPAGTEPHDWEPTPQDIVNIGESDVFVYSGAGMEEWVEKIGETVKNKDLIQVEASKGVELIRSDEHHEDDANEKEDMHDDIDEMDKDDDHDEHHHGEYDPHVWLSPKNAKKQMENIKDAFVKADPENKDYYQKNYDENASKLDELDKKFSDKLKNTKRKEIIVSHEAFAYMLKGYGIIQVGIEGLSPDSEPDANRMAKIAKFSKEHGVKYIFFEELVSSKISEAIAKEVGAKTEVLNPIEGLTEKQLNDGEEYFSIMEMNLTNILKALNE